MEWPYLCLVVFFLLKSSLSYVNIATSAFFFFCFLRYVVMWIIFKVCIELVATLLVLGFGFLTVGHVGSELPNQGLNLYPCPHRTRRSLNPWTARDSFSALICVNCVFYFIFFPILLLLICQCEQPANFFCKGLVSEYIRLCDHIWPLSLLPPLRHNPEQL